jgi:hypothetical protein
VDDVHSCGPFWAVFGIKLAVDFGLVA